MFGLWVSHLKHGIINNLKLLINKYYNETHRAISSVIIVEGIVLQYFIIKGAKVRKSGLIN